MSRHYPSWVSFISVLMQVSFLVTLVEGKFRKHVNKWCYLVAIVMMRIFLRDSLMLVDMFPKPSFDPQHRLHRDLH